MPEIPSWQRAASSNPPPSSSPSSADNSSTPSERSEPNPVPDAEESPKESSPLLGQASRFLQDPTIQDAPREKKVEYLQSKGVASKHIEKLLEGENIEEADVELASVGEKAWLKPPPPPPLPAKVPPREIPPIVTYPEFLTKSEKPPPLITTQRLLNTTYIAGGLMATMYGLSKYIIAPMVERLVESRHDLASHAQEHLSEFNKRLGDVTSIDPANKPKSSVSDTLDDISEADSDPTELFHRDFGTQTTPSLSRRSSVSDGPEVEQSIAIKHQNRLKILTAHLSELQATHTNDKASSNSLKTKLSDLTTYLGDMTYQNQYQNGMGSMLFGPSSGPPKTKDGKDDQIEILKSDIRAVKGVFLSARNFPAGGRNSPAVGA